MRLMGPMGLMRLMTRVHKGLRRHKKAGAQTPVARRPLERFSLNLNHHSCFPGIRLAGTFLQKNFRNSLGGDSGPSLMVARIVPTRGPGTMKAGSETRRHR